MNHEHFDVSPENAYAGKMDEFASFVFSEDAQTDELIPVFIQEEGSTEQVSIFAVDAELQNQFFLRLFGNGLQILWNINVETDGVPYAIITKEHVDTMNKYLKRIGVQVDIKRNWIEMVGENTKALQNAEIVFSFTDFLKKYK